MSEDDPYVFETGVMFTVNELASLGYHYLGTTFFIYD